VQALLTDVTGGFIGKTVALLIRKKGEKKKEKKKKKKKKVFGTSSCISAYVVMGLYLLIWLVGLLYSINMTARSSVILPLSPRIL